MTRHVAVQRHLARPSIEIRGERLAKERLCRRNAAVTAKKKVDRLSLLVDRSIQVVPFASNANVRLVGAPGSTDGSRESVPALFIFRHVPGSGASADTTSFFRVRIEKRVRLQVAKSGEMQRLRK